MKKTNNVNVGVTSKISNLDFFKKLPSIGKLGEKTTEKGQDQLSESGFCCPDCDCGSDAPPANNVFYCTDCDCTTDAPQCYSLPLRHIPENS